MSEAVQQQTKNPPITDEQAKEQKADLQWVIGQAKSEFDFIDKDKSGVMTDKESDQYLLSAVKKEADTQIEEGKLPLVALEVGERLATGLYLVDPQVKAVLAYAEERFNNTEAEIEAEIGISKNDLSAIKTVLETIDLKAITEKFTAYSDEDLEGSIRSSGTNNYEKLQLTIEVLRREYAQRSGK